MQQSGFFGVTVLLVCQYCQCGLFVVWYCLVIFIAAAFTWWMQSHVASFDVAEHLQLCLVSVTVLFGYYSLAFCVFVFGAAVLFCLVTDSVAVLSCVSAAVSFLVNAVAVS